MCGLTSSFQCMESLTISTVDSDTSAETNMLSPRCQFTLSTSFTWSCVFCKPLYIQSIRITYQKTEAIQKQSSSTSSSSSASSSLSNVIRILNPPQPWSPPFQVLPHTKSYKSHIQPAAASIPDASFPAASCPGDGTWPTARFTKKN